ncbi:phosphoglycerate mutase family protein [Zopfia rhizophila CBS 207.26]|uniref:Phosphoglycerate mutase family protein n=1 Tax=Zopfia rhizophila CBS 207.26 TaxID=1314779 RepID=A0A6A6DLS1_9PEZI|nr:phosphoglycerate mutase family protein [Zopfia rhizophila CBS 207.26]
MLEVIYVVRHAFRANWTVNPITGEYNSTITSPTGIPTDPPLAAHGVEQSNELAKHLCSLDPPIDVVYSSPFYRCLQTLKPATDKLFSNGLAGSRIRIDTGLGEFYGRADFNHPTPPTVGVLSPFFNYLDYDYISVSAPTPNGETIQELHDRVGFTLNRIISALDEDPAQPKALLICTHAATMIAIGRMLTGNMPEDPDTDDFQCFTASLSKFTRQSSEAVGSWNCVINSETAFLSGGAERGWKFNGEESFIQLPHVVVEAKGARL